MAGAGLGSVVNMIITLRNNRNELRGPANFNSKKHYFNRKRDEFIAGRKIKLELHPLSQEELVKFKARIRNENQKRKKTIILLLSIIAIIIVFASLYVIGNIRKVETEHAKAHEKKREKDRIEMLKQKQAMYNSLIMEGDNKLNKQNFEMAIVDYNAAIQMDINNIEAQKRIMFAYYQQCLIYNDKCDLAIDEIKYLLKIYPKDVYLYELLINSKEIKRDTTELEKYNIILSGLKKQLTNKLQ